MADAGTFFSIFLEAAHRASIIPLASEATLYALKSFGSVALQWPIAIAIAGSLAGHIFNMLLGRLLMRLPSSPKNQLIFQRLQTHFNRYGFLVLVFACLSLGNILTIAAGMLGTPMKKALPVITAGLIWYYGRLLA